MDVEELEWKLYQAEQERDAAKKQALNLQEEYDCLCEQLNEMQVSSFYSYMLLGSWRRQEDRLRLKLLYC
jgi:hypothetical protein